MDALELWRRYKKHLVTVADLGIRLDISRMPFDDGFFDHMEPTMQAAFEAMAQLESGSIANPDEDRMVGHYWLRAPHKAPTPELADTIEHTVQDVVRFAQAVHNRQIVPPGAAKFTDVLVVGIGGSALGPQLVADALTTPRDKMAVHFLDNTDPDGFDRTFAQLGARIKSTLVLVISKSGSTKETRNGMIEAQRYFARKNLDFAKQAVAITGQGSELDNLAINQAWLKRFPMWDWVGGRTSVMSAVGLVPAALQGIDVQSLLDGAAAMDTATRSRDTQKNIAAVLALMWHFATNGRGEKDMVVLPYKDRLLLLSRYLQQLIMESLGKEFDLAGRVVNQGISVYGNKGSTDQHAYVQQLREGVNNFFANFIVVLQDRQPQAAKVAGEVEPGVMTGDYLSGFWQGTRTALYEKGRPSLTITLDQLSARTLGALIALYERAVGFYASLVNINAYHQPGVEAGKKAAGAVLSLQAKVVEFLKANPQPASPEQIADRMAATAQVETINHILEHLSANKRGVVVVRGKYKWKG